MKIELPHESMSADKLGRSDLLDRVIGSVCLADAVVVIAFIGDTAHGASYGANRKKCEATGEWLDHLLDDMGDGLTPRPQL
jgi:hypothetical protein